MGEEAARAYIREMLESPESEGLTLGWQAYRIAKSMDGIIRSIENGGPEATLKAYGRSIKLQPEVEVLVGSVGKSYLSTLSALRRIENIYRNILEEEYGLKSFSIVDIGHEEDERSGLDNGGMVHLLDTLLMVHALSNDMEPEELLDLFFDFGRLRTIRLCTTASTLASGISSIGCPTGCRRRKGNAS